MSSCEVNKSPYYQIARFALYNGDCNNKKWKNTELCKKSDFFINSDQVKMSHASFFGSAFIIYNKLIIGIAGTKVDSIFSVFDVVSDIQIIAGIRPIQLDIAEKFVNHVKNKFVDKYDQVIITGTSLGGALAEMVNHESKVDVVYSFDPLGTKGIIQENHSCNSMFIYAHNNVINRINEQSSGHSVKIHNPDYGLAKYHILLLMLPSHYIEVLGSGSIHSEAVKTIGGCSEGFATDMIDHFCSW